MKKKRIWYGMLVTVLVLSMMFFGCEEPKDEEASNEDLLNGTWVWTGEAFLCTNWPDCQNECVENSYQSITPELELTFDNGNWEEFRYYTYLGNDIATEKGTYTVNGNILTLIRTHVNGLIFELNDEWYSKTELEAALKAKGTPDDQIEGISSMIHFSISVTFIVSEAELIIKGEDTSEASIFDRK